ncbi:MFS transporter [Pseudomonas sp. NPDC089554]|uniref:MFS transporter n=1 Tax=Pseudomonas sp. NPDC089554 TaxID=3390653 RepID=UPI003D0349A2
MTTSTIGAEAGLRKILWLLAPAITLVVASEFIVVGLLPMVAAQFALSLAEAGRLTSLFALSAATLGPGLTLLASRWPPRQVLVATLLLFALGNGVMAWATRFDWLLVARFAQGAALPAFVSVSAAVVTALALPGRKGNALANANIGFVLGVLLALPMGVVVAQWGDWRMPFAVLTVASLASAAMTWLYFPDIRLDNPPSVGEQLQLLRQPVFLLHLLLSVVLFAAMFAAYTFLAAWLERGLQLSSREVALALLLFSVGGLFGNSVAARVVDRAPTLATAVTALALAVSVNAADAFAGLWPVVVVLMGVWSMAHTAGVTLSQVRVTLVGGRSSAFAMTMNLACANLGIAIGAFSGGWSMDRWGDQAIGWAPAAFALVALGLCVLLVLGGSRRDR